VGTPVVASNIGGLPYIVDDGKTGLLFEAGNSNDLHNKLLWIIEHQQEALEMGRRGVQAARKRWSAMAHYDGLMKIYQDVIESRATEIHLS
jgi:glycosyltransferase involved in cell wall biosynthesis